MRISPVRIVSSSCIAGLFAALAAAQPSAPDPMTTAPAGNVGQLSENESTPQATKDTIDPNAPADVTVGQVEAMLQINKELQEEVRRLRHELAHKTVEHGQALEQLEELRQFIHDHDAYRDDFTKYASVRAIAEREEARRRAEARKKRQERERAERLVRRQERNAQQQAQKQEERRESRYRDAGFSHIGLDVYTNRMAFAYHTADTVRTRIDYDPLIGNYIRVDDDETRVDYSNMTISGSVLNAQDAVRNIGVGIAFFDENGNQVGSETIQVANARPNVPYPFTSEVDMALDRAFSTSSVYVLYADTVEE